ncbi:MAG: hypothetical protein LBJ41_03250 [Treponema sp.]|jgi:hypothetical protein|nr:hypothetical protein [Treponema sp.]
MKKKLFCAGMAALLLSFELVLLACPTGDTGEKKTGGGTKDEDVPYAGFYQYPTGRANANGTLTIRNAANSQALLFTGSVGPANYIGTVEGLSSIKVSLPTENFYTIVAVEKANYEDKGNQAYQFSGFTYYSSIQPYSISVSPSNLSGAGKWILSNQSTYWVALQKADASGDNWAVLAPGTLRTEIPIPIGTNIDFVPHYYKELKYNGKVIALVEFDDVAQADTVATSTNSPTFTTTIGATVTPPSANLKPAVLITNNSDKSVRIYSGQNNQLSPSGTPGEDYAMASGWTAMITSGIEEGANTNTINFASISWQSREYVSVDKVMEKDKVYRIVLAGNQTTGYTTTVEEDSVEEFFENGFRVTVATDISYGSISASPTSGTAGTTVTLSNTPGSGYFLGYYTVNGSQITGNSFTLNRNVTVSAVFIPLSVYTVTVTTGISHGSISASSTSGTAGTTVTLSNTPGSGYVLGYYTVNGTQISGNSFTLNGNVTVSAVFNPLPVYTITVTTGISHGSISASPASGTAGTTVTLSNTADSGYVLDYYTVDGERITGNSFTLTDDNVTVSAVFNLNLPIPIGSPSVILYLNDGTSPLAEGGRTNISSAGSGTYTVRIANGSYSQIRWYLNGTAVPGQTGTSIALSKETPGVYLITVEAAPVGGDKNTGSHTFEVQ